MLVYFKVIILLIAAFLMRPTALGQSYTSVAIVLSLIILAVSFMEKVATSNKSLTISRQNFLVLITSILLWSYLFVQAGILDSSNLDFAIKAVVAHILIITSFAFVLNDKKTNTAFFRAFILVIVFTAYSYVVTLILSYFVGFAPLYLFTMTVKGYGDSGLSNIMSTGSVFFPFTVLYGVYTVGNIAFPRLLGLFREAGIYQAFLIWAFFSLKFYQLDKKIIKIIIITGIIGTFSTAGIGIFIVTLALKYYLENKVLRSLLIVAVAFMAALYAPIIGLNSKIVTHSTSITDRIYSTVHGLSIMLNNPFGIGFYNSGLDYSNAGINLLAASSMIGLIGLVLAVSIYFIPAFTQHPKKYFIISVFPILMTSVFAQPIFDAPLVYIMLMAQYKFEKEPLKQIIIEDINLNQQLPLDSLN